VPCSDVNGLTTQEVKLELSAAEFSLTNLCSIDYSQLILFYLHFAKLTINRSWIRLNSVLKIILDAVYLGTQFLFFFKNWTLQYGTLDVQQQTLQEVLGRKKKLYIRGPVLFWKTATICKLKCLRHIIIFGHDLVLSISPSTSVSSHTRPCSKPRRTTFNREERRLNFVSHRCITSRDFMQERPVFLTVSTILWLDVANQNKFNTTNSIHC